MDKIEYEKLCEEIWMHNRRYYVEHAPTISDEKFDFLLKELERIEKEHPDFVAQLVRKALSAVARLVERQAAMLSYDDVFWVLAAGFLVMLPLVLAMRPLHEGSRDLGLALEAGSLEGS